MELFSNPGVVNIDALRASAEVNGYRDIQEMMAILFITLFQMEWKALDVDMFIGMKIIVWRN